MMIFLDTLRLMMALFEKRHPNTVVYPHCFYNFIPFLFKIIGSYVTILTLFISHTSVSFLKSIFRLLYNIFINNTSLIKVTLTLYILIQNFSYHTIDFIN